MASSCPLPLKIARLLAIVVAVSITSAGPARAEESGPAALAKLRDEASQSLVTLKCVISLRIGGRGAGGDQETEAEVTGVMIEPSGLILCSNMQLGGIGGMVSRIFGRSVPGFSMTSEVVDVKVVVGGDEDEELPAKLLARDNDLDLAWIQIEEPDRTFPALKWSTDATPELGSRLVGVRQMGKHFDRLSVIGLFTLVGETEKPRKLWVTQEALSEHLGLPIWDLSGRALGVVVVQAPEPSGGGGGGMNPFSMMGSLSGLQESFAGMVLPASEVLRATERAKAAAESGADSSPADQPDDRDASDTDSNESESGESDPDDSDT